MITPTTADEDGLSYLADVAADLGLEGPLPPVERLTVEVSPAPVSVLRWGSSPGMTFLHGGGLYARTWDATLMLLGEEAYAFDLPGHGHSGWRDDFRYGPVDNAGSIAAAIDALAGRPQVLVGHSLGGLTAIALAAARPDLVSALVIVDVTPGLRPRDSAEVRDFVAGPLVFPSREAIVDRALAAGLGHSRRTLERGVVLNTRVREDGTVVYRHHLSEIPPNPNFHSEIVQLWPGLESIEVPVMLVRGQQGYLPDEVMDEFRSRVPRAAVVELDTGHNVHSQDPIGLVREVKDFLRAG